MDASPSHNVFLLSLLLCIIMINSVLCSLKVQCNKKDMNTLLNFKQRITDPSSLLSSWVMDQDCCQWTGVQCDNITGRVAELNLPCHAAIPSANDDKADKSHCLTGDFDLSLLDLEFLSYLNLSNNDFKPIRYNYVGSQKCRCENSSNLHYLDLSYNYDILMDNINWISDLSSLEYLNLNGIDLHKETDWLQSVTKLHSLLELHLENCQLQHVYPSLQYANFTSLKVLDLANNDFVPELLPSWLFNLSCDISYINLSQNHILGQLPKTLPNLRSIKHLDLSGNNLDGPISDWLGQLGHLQELDLSSNFFSGPIPTSLGNLSSLIVLNLMLNNLNGNIPKSLSQLFNLEVLRLRGNPFTGNVSERNMLSLSNLKYFTLSSPALVFDFDSKWVPPFQLESLSLSFVSPRLPSWLYTQTSLKLMAITDSFVSFEPLDKFWNFVTRLELLSLTNNSINGDMSNVLLNSKVAWLNSNNLRGSLPRVSPNVTLLNINSNSLSGSISSLLCHNMKERSNIVYLDLSDNVLSGELTDCWMKWKSLVLVDLGNNSLTGKIPHTMGFLSNLESLNLNDNNFFGDVPLSLKYCHKLRTLNIGGNSFTGEVPNWMGQSVKALELRSNQFSGNIPPQICQLKHLMVLDLANNKLSGPIPNCLHNMTAMISDYVAIDNDFISIQVGDSPFTFSFNNLHLVVKGTERSHWNLMYALDLSSNNLSGTVPSEIYMLIRLQSLNLSHNQLLGTIPEEIGNLKQLESFDVSSNRLSGEIPSSLSGMSFLGALNLSFNNFTGKIPTGTQLQGFTNLSYIGNPELCGPPLTNNCLEDEKPHNTKLMGEDDGEDSEVDSWFYAGLGIGFATAFWGVLGAILFSRRCRDAYFRFVDRLNAMMILKMDSVRWNIRNCLSGPWRACLD